MLAPIFNLSGPKTKIKVALDFGVENREWIKISDIMRKAKYIILDDKLEYIKANYEVRGADSYRKGIVYCSVHISFNTKEESDVCRRKYRAAYEMKILDANREVLYICEF